MGFGAFGVGLLGFFGDVALKLNMEEKPPEKKPCGTLGC